jgi:hypothetical protein
MISELTYQFIESSFIKHLELIDQLSVENILEKLKKVNVLCNNNKSDLTLIYFAYYDLYITQLKKLNYKNNFGIDIDNDKINENIKNQITINFIILLILLYFIILYSKVYQSRTPESDCNFIHKCFNNSHARSLSGIKIHKHRAFWIRNFRKKTKCQRIFQSLYSVICS